MITGYAEAEAISDRPERVEVIPKPFTLHSFRPRFPGSTTLAMLRDRHRRPLFQRDGE